MDWNIFRGRRGEFVVVIVIACLGLVEIITSKTFRDSDYYLRERWPIPTGLLLSAAVIRMLTQRKSTGQPFEPPEWIVSSSSHPAKGVSPNG
jgi:hypothetical protein